MTRYWKNTYSHWIESDYLFDLQDGPYDDIFVFDDYALALKNSRLIYAVFFDEVRNKVVPGYLVKMVYNTLERGSKIERMVVFDQDGQGDFNAVCAIKGADGVLLMYPYEIDIDWQDKKGVLNRKNASKSILP